MKHAPGPVFPFRGAQLSGPGAAKPRLLCWFPWNVLPAGSLLAGAYDRWRIGRRARGNAGSVERALKRRAGSIPARSVPPWF